MNRRRRQNRGIGTIAITASLTGPGALACGAPDGGDTTAVTTLDSGLDSGLDTGLDASGSEDSGGDTGMRLDTPDGTTGGTTTGGDPSCPCGDNADLIYVLSDSATLWTYDPQSNLFNQLGAFSCPAPAFDTTFSMGVARSGVAWVMYTPSGDIFHVDVNDANACSDPGYTPGQNNFTLFGMAFASNSATDPCDRLYAHSFSGSIAGFSEGPNAGRLGRVDSAAAFPTILGAIDYDGGELTGTGDGRLFAFAGANPAKLIEYDKTNAAVIQTIPLSGLELTNAFAFAFWGGDFYFFTESAPLASTSKVTRLDFDGTMALETVNMNAPLRVVGAGVSTCAPFVPPG